MESNKVKRTLKKVLKETKENKEKILIEQKLVHTRILNIFESEENIKNFESLPKQKRIKIALQVMEELRELDENKILNEQLGDFLSKLFGSNLLKSLGETLVEPLVNSILSGLGIGGYFKNFLVSFLTSNPMELAKALRDCKVLTRLIANSLGEAIFMMMQEKTGAEGGFYTFLRNALGGAVKDTTFINKIEEYIGDFVCNAYNKLTKKAGEVLSKVNPQPGATASA